VLSSRTTLKLFEGTRELPDLLAPVLGINRRKIQWHRKRAPSTVMSGAAPISQILILIAVLTLRPLVLLTNSRIKILPSQ